MPACLRFALLSVVSLLSSAPLAAPSEPAVLETVVVTGKLPGPALWQVRHDGHTLWILGTVSPLPKGMQWDSSEVETVLAEAGEVLSPGGVESKVGASAALKIATLARSAFAATRNPDGRTLADVLPAELHARWMPMKALYLAGNDSVEKSRPLFASQDLYYGAIDVSGLTRANVAWNAVAALAEARGVPVTGTRLEIPLEIDRGTYKAGIRALARSEVDDLGCFAQTLDTLPADLERMKQGANAWATGDIDRLRATRGDAALPACKLLYDEAMSFQQRPQDAAAADARWLELAEAALRRNPTTFATLPMHELLTEGGLVARLAERGYTVLAPDAGTAADDRDGANDTENAEDAP